MFITPHDFLIKYLRANTHHMSRGVVYSQVLERERCNLASHQRAQGRGRCGECFWAFYVFLVAWWEGDGVEVCGYLRSCIAGWCWGVFEMFHYVGVNMDMGMYVTHIGRRTRKYLSLIVR